MNLSDLTPEQQEEILKTMEKVDKPLTSGELVPYIDPVSLAVTGGMVKLTSSNPISSAKNLGKILKEKTKDVGEAITVQAKRGALKQISDMAAKRAEERALSDGMMAREAGKASNILNPMLDAIDDIAASPKFLPTRTNIATVPQASDMLENAENERFFRLQKRFKK